MRITAPITSANRRDVTPRSFARYFCVMLPVAVHLSCLIDVVGRATTWRSVVVREFGYRTDAIRVGGFRSRCEPRHTFSR